ncbi:ankyrin repeat and SOCS box protein 5-like isoform X2 [Archocentrus centrarchus]|uniref:ankyrin repeat and SOCS box protein 5-like isoform X2 n=1 Tax=Archocentrus centrarchus TaxID=63155 RepID=UPI0011E9C8AB|nr:ankyrin repeat and SOCS box protein 5-like isoform X2 [Archocentrus centrarchus]
MPEGPSGAAEVSRKRGADPGLLFKHVPERKRACWGILTSQGSWADRSPLHEAASQGRLLALRTLLAQVNAATIDGITPLYNCCASGSVGCMELLLQSGAHRRAPHTHFPSALHEACKRGNSQCVESLLSHGADPDDEVSHLGSPLYVSCLHRHTACSKILLHRGADVSVGRGCDSPLHAAVRQDSADQVSLLLDYGANINLRDSNNQRPVELAPPGGKTQQLLLAFEVSPRSLCQLCRLRIRNLIGRSRLKLLPLLPLPALLTHYLEHISNEQ